MGVFYTRTTIFEDEQIAAAGDTTSVAIATTGQGGSFYIYGTNSSAGPTAPVQFQREVSPDNTNWFEYGAPYVAPVTNSASWKTADLRIPFGVQYVRVVATGNDDQEVSIVLGTYEDFHVGL